MPPETKCYSTGDGQSIYMKLQIAKLRPQLIFPVGWGLGLGWPSSIFQDDSGFLENKMIL